jgi:hypothetical protein
MYIHLDSYPISIQLRKTRPSIFIHVSISVRAAIATKKRLN